VHATGIKTGMKNVASVQHQYGRTGKQNI